MAGKSALSKGVLSPDDKYYASVSWSGKVSIWTAGKKEEMKEVTALEGHSYQAYDLDWHPDFPKCDGQGINMVTCGADCTIRLWTFDLELEK
jgi:WD40 repeat protein